MPRLYRKVIRVQATDSPNVKLALRQQAQGLPITGDVLIPGLLTWDLYRKRRQTWDAIRQCVGLDGKFYEGAEIKMFPPVWLNRAEELARLRRVNYHLKKYLGIDPAEGGDKSTFCVIDSTGVVELLSYKTPDTTFVSAQVRALAIKWSIAPEDIFIDRGGGGKEHADYMALDGFEINTVGFGETLVPDPHDGKDWTEERLENREERYAYKNRRAQMYDMIRQLINPVNEGFAIPEEYVELRRQLEPIPLTYDQEGRMYLLPKRPRDEKDKRPNLLSLLGCSPDEADSLALACYAMMHTDYVREITVM